MGSVGVAHVETRQVDVVCLDEARRAQTVVALQSIRCAAELVDAATVDPSCRRELVALKEFQIVALGDGLFAHRHMDGDVAAVGLDGDIGLGGAGERGFVIELEMGGLVHTQAHAHGVHGQADAVWSL